MSRYTGPSWKISRRLGISLSGTGKELARRPYAPCLLYTSDAADD